MRPTRAPSSPRGDEARAIARQVRETGFAAVNENSTMQSYIAYELGDGAYASYYDGELRKVVFVHKAFVRKSLAAVAPVAQPERGLVFVTCTKPDHPTRRFRSRVLAEAYIHGQTMFGDCVREHKVLEIEDAIPTLDHDAALQLLGEVLTGDSLR